MKFSIITPVWFDKEDEDNKRQPRYEMFLRCANSIATQTETDFEWIVVDDFSNPPVSELIESFKIKPKIIRLEEKSGRITARNRGMAEAQGNWICWLDADDEYASTYLELINQASYFYPNYYVFNFNHLIFNYDFSVYQRDFIDMDVQGLAPFRAGRVGAGSFVFKKKVVDDIGLLPELSLWDLAEWAFEHYPEIKPLYYNEKNGQYDSLGNPWGEDYLYFYMMTRKYSCKKLNAAPYFVHSHWGHKLLDEEPGKGPQWNPNLK